MLSLDMLLALLTGALVGGGLILLVIAIRGFRSRPAKPGTGRADQLRAMPGKIGAAVVVGAITLVVTHWVVGGIGAALLVIGWRGLAGGAASERGAMARLEALASWTESLRDTIAGAVGLEQAIPASTRAANPAIVGPLQTMVDRLHTRVPLPEALRTFADELNDPGADMVVAALILNARLRGPGLRDLLGALASSAREELDARRRIEGERKATRRSVQIVVGVSLGVMVMLVLFNRSYVAEYGTPIGQVVLAVVAALYGAGFLWLRRLARFETPQRFLASTGSGLAPGLPGEVPDGGHAGGEANPFHSAAAAGADGHAVPGGTR